MNQGGESIKVVHPLFQEEGGGSIPTSPLQLHIGRVSPEVAIDLNASWHSRLPHVDKNNIQRTAHMVCYAAEFAGLFYATAIWTDPIARNLNGRGWLELRRLAIGPRAPKNTASRMLRVMRALVRERFRDISKLISYQDTSVHAGTIYRAAGWIPLDVGSASNNWETANRFRKRPTPEQSATPKIRWEYDIRPPTSRSTAPPEALGQMEQNELL